MKNLSLECPKLEQLRTYFAEHKKQILEEYFTFLRFESVSTDPAYADKVLACSEWLAHYVKQLGFDLEIWQTEKYPVLFASYEKAGPHAPTLLIYNHYDVQPIDPVSEWDSPPFEPTIRHGEVFARGAQDNKGQCFYVLQALKAVLHFLGKFPVNIKLCIEGEEETGSNGLAQLLKKKKRELTADYLAIVDVGISEKNKPSVTSGVRGLVTMEVVAQGPNIDLHSGSHGGVVPNPIHALVQILASLRDDQGKVAIPKFYDGILPLDALERSQFNWDFDEKEYANLFGAPPLGGERDLLPLERLWVRPTLEINGISGGYSGNGFKTVIPSKASAKISCRLVPGQNPETITQLVAEFIKNNTPQGITTKITKYPGGGTAVRANPNSHIIQAFKKAFSEVFNKACDVVLGGASIPIVTELASVSGAEVALIGMGLPDDQIHAPNEHFGVDRLEQGFLIMGRVFSFLTPEK